MSDCQLEQKLAVALDEIKRVQAVANTQTECVLDAEERRAETIAMCTQLRLELDAMRNLVDRAVTMFYFACPELRADGLVNHNNPVLKWFVDAKSALGAAFANDLVKTWVASGDASSARSMKCPTSPAGTHVRCLASDACLYCEGSLPLTAPTCATPNAKTKEDA